MSHDQASIWLLIEKQYLYTEKEEALQQYSMHYCIMS